MGAGRGGAAGAVSGPIARWASAGSTSSRRGVATDAPAGADVSRTGAPCDARARAADPEAGGVAGAVACPDVSDDAAAVADGSGVAVGAASVGRAVGVDGAGAETGLAFSTAHCQPRPPAAGRQSQLCCAPAPAPSRLPAVPSATCSRPRTRRRLSGLRRADTGWIRCSGPVAIPPGPARRGSWLYWIFWVAQTRIKSAAVQLPPPDRGHLCRRRWRRWDREPAVGSP